MHTSDAERREFEIDEVFALSLHHQGRNPVVVHAEDSEMALLQLDREPSWCVLTGPQTLTILAVLDLGYVHLAWSMDEPGGAAIRRQLSRGVQIPITVISPSPGTLRITAPRFPESLLPLLEAPYAPVEAA